MQCHQLTPILTFRMTKASSASLGQRLASYYWLCKPGIVYGNAIVAAGAFLLAARGVIDIELLMAMIGGTSLVIACGCVFNNFIDRDLDRRMDRTHNRALVTGQISSHSAIIFASLLGCLGFGLLSRTNPLTMLIGLIGLVVYVVVYGFFKRRSIHGTLIGSVAGSMPPVAGYVAVSNRIDGGALILFLILTFWQMAHFYAIAIYRLADYRAAGLPVMPVVKGVAATRRQIMAYIVAFILACAALTFYGYSGYSFLVVIGGLGLGWLYIAIDGFGVAADSSWAQRVFVFSLLLIVASPLMWSLSSLLP